ncbi:methyltransferase [Streptomyces sp. CB02923]|uniref:class I SAM-dependent methyltransferase n=1 Tax=Streptomyces sp. CB02923 TaxID=1718985 RepID=UPI00093A1C25|nr:class I SAM-dependent methyltransferase [Streptomyces sp. CB02923]OKH99015.1 methyltransferase [Streptomyces sp. CB02923]
MPFNHNDHYHELLLRELPATCHQALDVGCGTGSLARKLASRGIDVDAVDADGDVIAAAQKQSSAIELPGHIRFEQADITELTLPPGTYDYIVCVASIHHVPFDTVRKLRAALTANGVLVILGCYRAATLRDHAVGLLAVPVNAVLRTAVFLREKLSKDRTVMGTSTTDASATGTPGGHITTAPVAPPSMSFAEVRESAATDLPRSRMRQLLFWRYLLVFRNTEREAGQ